MASAEIEDKLNKGVRMHLKLEPFNAYFKKWVKLYKSIVREGTQTNYKNSIKAIDKLFRYNATSTPRKKVATNFSSTSLVKIIASNKLRRLILIFEPVF